MEPIGWEKSGKIPSRIQYNILRALELKNENRSGLRIWLQTDDIKRRLGKDKIMFFHHGHLDDMVSLGWIEATTVKAYHITEDGVKVLKALRTIFKHQKEVATSF